MIIIEGPDGSGKTTLCKRLLKDIPELKLGEWPTRDKMWEITRQFTYWAISKSVYPDEPCRLWDRLFYSELVYGPIRGECEFTTHETPMIQNLIKVLGIPVVFCMLPLHILRANCIRTKQHEGVLENISEIHTNYYRLAMRYRPLIYDYTGVNEYSTPYEQLVGKLKFYLMQREYRTP